MTKLKWISVKDRKPKPGEGVYLVWDGKSAHTKILFSEDGKNWEYEDISGAWIKLEKPVTHWIPYPEIEEPPKD